MSVDSSFFLPEALVLDVPEMDAQHRALFAGLAELKAVCVKENRLPLALADHLLRDLEEHFATEERLADEAGFDFSEHTEKHGRMLEAITRGMVDVRTGKRDVFGMLRFVEYWFERHIKEDDRLLGESLVALRSAPMGLRRTDDIPAATV